MTKIIFLAAALAAIPPMPPGFRSPAPTVSPKHLDLIQSLGRPMIKVRALPPKTLVVPMPKVIVDTNRPIMANPIISNGQVTLSWQNGSPPFQIEGEPSLNGPWNLEGEPTTAHTKTFPQDHNQFFRVQGNMVMSLEASVTNNTVTLNWDEPESTSGTFGPFNLFSRTNPPTGPPSDPTGWGSPIQTIPSTARSSTVTQTSATNWYRLTQNFTNTMASRVEIDWNVVTASLNTLVPGTVNWVKSLTYQTQFGGGGSLTVGGVATDSHDNVYVVGSFTGKADLGDGLAVAAVGLLDAFMVKFNSAGALQWKRTIGSSGNSMLLSGVTVDQSDNAIAIGSFSGSMTIPSTPNALSGTSFTSHGSDDVFISQFDTNGGLGWTRQVGGVNNDVGTGITLDPLSGNLVATIALGSINCDFGSGFILSSNGSYDVAVMKMTVTTGVTIWAISHGDSDVDYPNAVAVDKSGDVYVVGYFFTSTHLGGAQLISVGQQDGFLVKYSGSDGHFIAQQQYGSPTADSALGVACDPTSGNVVVTGTSNGASLGTGSSSKIGLFLVGYQPDLTWLWEFVTGISGDTGSKVAIDSNGLMVFVGQANGGIYFGPPSVTKYGNGASDYFAAGFSISGNNKPVWRWTNRDATGAGTGAGVSMRTYAVVIGNFNTSTDVGGGHTANSPTGVDAGLVCQYVK